MDAVVVSSIRKVAEAPESSGLFFDFDGVLADIQDNPDTVHALPGIPDLLGRLAGRLTTVTIISSRPALFLWDRLGGVGRLDILGLYGLEWTDSSGRVSVAPEARRWLDVVPEIVIAAQQELPGSIYIENKRLSVGLHYRSDPDEKHNVENWSARARERWGVKVQPGRLAVELKPDVGTDKGTVLAQRADKLRTAWYSGDDLGDLPAFNYLSRRGAHEKTFTGISVGVGNDTIVPEVFDACDVFVDAPTTLSLLLGRLAESLSC
jgi:trehalose 6-phosphate phosphatase